MSPLHVASFGGGVVLEGAADTRRVDEVLRADAIDIGPRGALVCTSDAEDYTTLTDAKAIPGPQPWDRLWAILSIAGFNFVKTIAIGEGFGGATRVYIGNAFARTGAAPTTPVGPDSFGFQEFTAPFPPVAVAAPGVIVTSTSFPGVYQVDFGGGPVDIRLALVNLGAREGFAPRAAPGLYALFAVPPSTIVAAYPIGMFDALGTGAFGELPTGGGAAGTMALQLFARGVIAYNNHVFAWGFDNADATNGDGPNRVMFSNLGLPLKYGNDNQANTGVDRSFTDSDAIVLGDAGEIIRGAIVWAGKLWFGTNRGLHFIAGYGRDSYVTDGANPVARAFNITGAHCLFEGPDRMLYGVADEGLWAFNGQDFTAHFRKLVNFAGRSPGYWDLLWTDESLPLGTYPGATNRDLVWMAQDWDRRQVLVGIPWCNAEDGEGPGLDTVVIRFHVDTGGFTRQVFAGVQYTAAAFFRAEVNQGDARFFGTATVGQVTIRKYGALDGVLPSRLPVAGLGYYVPFGPDGEGVVRRVYLTLSWDDDAALPIVFRVETSVDKNPIDNFLLTIGPTAPPFPAVGDNWLDTSETDTSIGNATAATGIPARGGFLLKVWTDSGTWLTVAGQGAKFNRATIPLGLTRVTGTRVDVTATCTLANGRFQLEGLGLAPGGGTPGV